MKQIPIALLSLSAVLMISTVGDAQQVKPAGRPVLDAAQHLKPGEYIWEPQLSPAGPALVLVNLDAQRLVLFRDGVPIAASSISSGAKGHETPTGVFTILQKHKDHYSSTYNNAPMPNMQRLTWKGVALHAGKLPGYPASHGCVRLPHQFSALLFGQTQEGMTVVITEHPTVPHSAEAPDVAFEPAAAHTRETIKNAAFEWHPERAADGIVSVVISKADHKAMVMKGGTLIGSGPVVVHGQLHGALIYVLESWDNQGPHWLQVQLSGAGKGMRLGVHEGEHFDAPAKFRHDVQSVMRPGSVVIVTPASLRSGGPGTGETVLAENG